MGINGSNGMSIQNENQIMTEYSKEILGIEGILVDVRGGFANQLYVLAYAYVISLIYGRSITQIVRTAECSCDPYALDVFDFPFADKIIISDIVEKNNLFLKLLDRDDCFLVTDKNALEVVRNKNEKMDKSGLILLNGVFQQFACISPYVKHIREVFTWKSAFYSSFCKMIASQTSVGIHVRRRDFVYIGHSSNDDYYRAAVVVMDELLGNDVQYYVFSDDIDYTKTIFGKNSRIHYVIKSGGRDKQFDEFFALSACDHRILTRWSSYGRMADILRSNADGITIYKGDEDNVENFVYLNDDMIADKSKQYTLSLSEVEEGRYDYVRDSSETLPGESDILVYREQYDQGTGSFHNQDFYERLLSVGANVDATAVLCRAYMNKSVFSTCYSDIDFLAIKLSDFLLSRVFILVPQRAFSSVVFEEMYNFGFFIHKCGGKAVFVLKERCAEGTIANKDNLILHGSGQFIDAYDYIHGGIVIDSSLSSSDDEMLGKVENEIDNRKAVVICKDYNDLTIFKGLNKQKVLVYWDNSNINDIGNYEFYDEELETDMGYYSSTKNPVLADLLITSCQKCSDTNAIKVAENCKEIEKERKSFVSYFFTSRKYLDILNDIIDQTVVK